MALERGKLVLSKKGKPLIEIAGKQFNPAQAEMSRSLLDNLKAFAGKEVEFERVGGQPKKIREVGGTFVPPQPDVGSGGRDTRGPSRASGSQPRRSQERQEWRLRDNTPPDFHNPYNFVSAPPRNTSDPDLGDQRPVAQDAFCEDRYSGVIRVKMTAKTPLLVPDTERAQEDANGHKTFPLRVGADGKPLIPASSVRGMLRSAYEAVTNSRFGRFSQEQHGDRLAFRMDAREGLRLIPARIEEGRIRLLTGTSGVGTDGRPNEPMYAAWLPRYGRNGLVASWAVRYADGSLPAHGDEVVCWVEKMQHTNPNFVFWRVREAVRGNDLNALGRQPNASPARGNTAPAQPAEMRQIHGWVCVTNANINRKHDERVFFSDTNSAPRPLRVTDEHRRKWRELIRNYQSIHKEDLRRRDREGKRYDAYLGPEPGRTAWSRHVYTNKDRELTDGTLCYVRLNKNQCLNENQSDVEALFPVMIARELYPASPWDLLHDSLRPAATIDQLSPADRVFGWVKVDADAGGRARGERVAARGLLRVGPVCCESDKSDAVERFAAPGVPLAILSAPKPQQGRFYVARSPNGEAQPDGLSKQAAGYSPGKGLRGRKVYPHHKALPHGHWDNPTEDRTQQPLGTPAHYQEYRRPRKNGQEQRDDQNRSILGWVKPGAIFSFDIHVMNLSKVELGALVWLLELPDNCFLRFGGGKPLGFGSVRLEIDSCDLRTGTGLRERYSAWLDGSRPSDPHPEVAAEFRQAVVRAYPAGGGGFDDVAFIRAFLHACEGHHDQLPTHYPRATANGQPGPPSPDGESFKWFVANERNERKCARYALPDLATDRGLPTLPERPGGGRGRPRGQRQGPPRDRDRGGQRRGR